MASYFIRLWRVRRSTFFRRPLTPLFQLYLIFNRRSLRSKMRDLVLPTLAFMSPCFLLVIISPALGWVNVAYYVRNACLRSPFLNSKRRACSRADTGSATSLPRTSTRSSSSLPST